MHQLLSPLTLPAANVRNQNNCNCPIFHSTPAHQPQEAGARPRVPWPVFRLFASSPLATLGAASGTRHAAASVQHRRTHPSILGIKAGLHSRRRICTMSGVYEMRQPGQFEVLQSGVTFKHEPAKNKDLSPSSRKTAEQYLAIFK